ncbi:hypothetical protein BC835DRAFT_1261295 [Cytidiella melzeri]|nr:hypothetical protein BC835DRAFT_1261295 [Cytidiella melzeri]
MAAASELNVSLEPHLLEALSPLQPLLPEPLCSQLRAALDAATSQTQSSSGIDDTIDASVTPVVPYALLSSISTWSRSPEGLSALKSCTPPLQSSDYSIVALLAGTRSAPDRTFPVGFAPLDYNGDAASRTEMNDRRAVTALINALLSIIGSGAATWWAAGRLGWQNEWKVLLALFASFVVAVSEAGLYLIWDSRRSKSRVNKRRRTRRTIAPAPREEPSEPFLSSHDDKSSSVCETPDSENQTVVHGQLIQDTNPNVQTHRTAEGLRARVQKQGSR